MGVSILVIIDCRLLLLPYELNAAVILIIMSVVVFSICLMYEELHGFDSIFCHVHFTRLKSFEIYTTVDWL